ncbi:uncharacterized protein LOC110906877 [Helianthus annuus]|uniref:uncharacterized protein LOC110906877 n=1 Tax=Helianthus annuus TaxID=4232 RepID=UPI001652E2BB|nr:uncharacterized protein LOC110906877 [Helianthus annuus]
MPPVSKYEHLSGHQKQTQSSSSNLGDDNVGEDNVKEDEEANVGEDNMNVDVDNVNAGEDNVNATVDEELVNPVPDIDIFDPRNWGGLSNDMIKELVIKGPKRDRDVVKGPVDKFGRHFSNNIFENGAFERLKCNETIDTSTYEQFRKEKDYWKQVILRIVAVVKFLAKYGLAFRGSNEKLYQKGNGNFLGLVEMLEEFDPIMKEHVRRVLNEKCHVHFLSHNIQNELIQLLGDKVRTEIIKKVKQAKYYSIILDCTPDTSHQEQMSIIVRWQILKDNVKGLTLKSLSTTRWESRIDSIKPIRTQLGDVRKALREVRGTDRDAKIISEAKSLEEYELGDFEFLAQIVIWFELLSKVNVVSKRLQAKDVVLDVAIDEVDKLIKFFKNYREVGFSKALDEAREIANEIGVNAEFRQKRVIYGKKHFDESSSVEEVTFSPEEDFRVNYFLSIVDQAIFSLETRFEQYQKFEKIFGFLFPKKLKTLDEAKLKECCYHLEDALKYEGESDIGAKELYTELKLITTFLPRHIDNPFDVLDYIFQRSTTYPYAINAYKVLLTIPITVASAERSFSKLKLLKTYLRSTMSQERLNGLATISIESEILDTMDYKEFESFASKNARRTILFA